MGDRPMNKPVVGCSPKQLARGTRMLHRPPRRLQQQPMLRGLSNWPSRAETPKKRRVEPSYVIDAACPAGHNLPGRVGI